VVHGDTEWMQKRGQSMKPIVDNYRRAESRLSLSHGREAANSGNVWTLRTFSTRLGVYRFVRFV